MSWGELVAAADGAPLLVGGLVVLGTAVWLAERIFALSGPATKLAAWWRGRTLAKLRREALLRAEQRRIEREEAKTREDDLEAQLADLRAEVEWLHGERADQRARDRARDTYDRRMAAWAHDTAARSRAAGVPISEPPSAPDLAPLLIEEDTAPMRLARNPARGPVPAR